MAVLAQSKTDELMGQLMKIDGKAEIAGGRIVKQMPTGKEPGLSALQIVVSLYMYAQRIGRGRAVGDNVIFRVDFTRSQIVFARRRLHGTGT